MFTAPPQWTPSSKTTDQKPPINNIVIKISMLKQEHFWRDLLVFMQVLCVLWVFASY